MFFSKLFFWRDVRQPSFPLSGVDVLAHPAPELRRCAPLVSVNGLQLRLSFAIKEYISELEDISVLFRGRELLNLRSPLGLHAVMLKDGDSDLLDTAQFEE